MADVFTWKHLPGAQGTLKFRVRTAQFGDGYSQTVKDGINNTVQTWPLQFEGDLSEMQPIYDFFVDKGGATSFLWTPPGNKQCLWKVANFSMTSIGGGVYSVSADFTQVFVP